MKSFQSAVEYLASLGITQSQAMQSNPFNVKNIVHMLLFGITAYLCGAFLIYTANSFKDYTESIYISSVTMLVFVVFVILIWKMENVFKFIETWKKTSEQSK